MADHMEQVTLADVHSLADKGAATAEATDSSSTGGNDDGTLEGASAHEGGSASTPQARVINELKNLIGEVQGGGAEVGVEVEAEVEAEIEAHVDPQLQ